MAAVPLPIFLVQLKAATALVDPIATRITVKAGDRVVREAQKIVPVDTGDLRRSIRTLKPITSGGKASISVTAGGGENNVDYAGHVELGTVKMSPQPYLRPALAKVQPQFEKELADVFQLLAAGRAVRVAGALRA